MKILINKFFSFFKKKMKAECIHERGEFQYWLAQGIKYFKCKKCGIIYED
jgi:hypothetical protein